MIRIGFIDYYLDEWHANHYPDWMKEASGGEVEVCYAYALIDSPKEGGRTTDQWCKDFQITRCNTIEEIVEKCDGLIVLSPDDCQMHEQLSEIPLKSGKPVYIDKTFAPSLQAARNIFDFAKDSGSPCYSTSALRYAVEYKDIDRSKIETICSWGPGNFEIYCIHQLEPIMMLMGVPAKRVMCMPHPTVKGGCRWMSMSIQFEDGRCATLANFENGAPFEMNICMGDENKIVYANSDFFHEFIVDMVAFFKDHKVRVPHEETLRIMAVREAGLKALNKPFEWIDVEA